MSDLADDLTVERIAREMIEFDLARALSTARERADEESRIGNAAGAARWRSIAEAIARIQGTD